MPLEQGFGAITLHLEDPDPLDIDYTGKSNQNSAIEQNIFVWNTLLKSLKKDNFNLLNASESLYKVKKGTFY